MWAEGVTGRARVLRKASLGLSEFMHLCAVYLGIAVLVSLMAAITVPAMRDQLNGMYQVVVDSLRSPPIKSIEKDKKKDKSEGAALAEAAMSVDSAYMQFATVLQQSATGLSIEGVSSEKLQALRSYLSRKYRLAPIITNALIELAYSNGREKGVDPLLVLAVIAIESTYNPFVESHAGAQGLMQVMTRVHQDKLEQYDEEGLAVFSPAANIQAGTQILADCRKRRGSLTGSLACYVGAVGPSDGGYGAKVLAERRRIALASGIAVKD